MIICNKSDTPYQKVYIQKMMKSRHPHLFYLVYYCLMYNPINTSRWFYHHIPIWLTDMPHNIHSCIEQQNGFVMNNWARQRLHSLMILIVPIWNNHHQFCSYSYKTRRYRIWYNRAIKKNVTSDNTRWKIFQDCHKTPCGNWHPHCILSTIWTLSLPTSPAFSTIHYSSPIIQDHSN